MDIKKKLLKIRNMIDDESLTKEERESWKLKYLSLKQQYKIEEEEVEQAILLVFRLTPKNEYENLLIQNIMSSYGLNEYYPSRKRESKHSLRIKCTQETYDLIMNDFRYFNKHLTLVLKASTYRFISEHIKYNYDCKQELNEEEEKEPRKFTKEELQIIELMKGMDSISDMKINKNKVISHK